MCLVSAQKETLLPLVLKVHFLLFVDLPFLKGARSASPVIDLKKTALSRHIIECLKQKLWSLVRAHSLSNGIYQNVAHSWHMKTTAFACLVNYILNSCRKHSLSSLACCFVLHPMMKLKWNLFECECVSECVCAFVHVTVCL